MVGTTTTILVAVFRNNPLDEARIHHKKTTTAGSLYIAMQQSCTTDVSRAKLQGGRLDGSRLGVRRLSARSPLQS